MIKKTIEYYDYSEPPAKLKEDFYFNINKLEALELEIKYEGGLAGYAEKLINTTEGTEAYYIFKEIILMSVGKKAPNGKGFDKKDPNTGRAYSHEFENSNALGELIFSFMDGTTGAEFVNGLLPSHIIKEAEEMAAEKKAAEEGKDGEKGSPVLETAPPVVVEEPPKELTDEELLKLKPTEMSPEQLQRAYILKSR